ncbi:MAG: class I SAM-dependent methyltransferase [Firmicutes bacterium]|nr:class I SAM-dependent methyltransferase [Bacillota bacterium]
MCQDNEIRTKEAVTRQVQEGFGMNAHAYVTSALHQSGSDLADMIANLHLQPEEVALDIATGGGHVANALAPHVRQVIALDLTRPMLEAARTYAQTLGLDSILYLVGDAEDLPFADASFDLVTCRIAAHHFPHPSQFVREAVRVLKPGGRFALTDNVSPEDLVAAEFFNAVERLRDVSHVWCPPISQWRAWLADAGLKELWNNTQCKTYRYREWVARTAHRTEQRDAVEKCLLEATPDLVRAFHIEKRDGRIEAFTGSQWSVICVKAMP